MGTIARFDRRADYILASRPRTLDRLMDLTALADESRGYLEQAHSQHWRDDAAGFLHSVERINRNLLRVGHITREMAGEMEASPAIPTDQLEVWGAALAA